MTGKTNKIAYISRLVGFRSIGQCDNCHHLIGYFQGGKELVHFLDLFPDDDLVEDISKTHCKFPHYEQQDEKTLVKLAELFNQVKELASERATVLEKFTKEWEDIFGTELPALTDSDSGIEWQDVLLWGIEDASFMSFLKDNHIPTASKEGVIS